MQQSIFRKKTEKINWKTLAAVDMERVVGQNDVRALRDNIKHVAFCNIDTELDLRDCDSGLLKLFKLSQLMIDYLLSSQDVLTGTVAAAEERAQIAIEEADAAKRKLQDSEAYLADIKRECHRRKKLILAQQQIMDSGPNAYHRCPYCEKAFLNGSFLQLHLEKRHADRYIAEFAEWRLHHHRDDGPAGTSPRRRHSPSPQQAQHAHVLTSERVELLLQQLLERSTGGSGRHGGHRKTLSGGGVGSPQGDGHLDSGSQRSLRDRDLRDRENEERLRKLSEAFQQDRDRWQDEAQRLRDEIMHLRRKADRRHQPQVADDSGATAGLTTQEQMERARQKAIDSRNKKTAATHDQSSPSRPAAIKKPEEAIIRTSMESQTRPQNASGTSPTRVPSPRKTSSSPARRDTMDRHSPFKSSNVSLDRFDKSGIDVSQDLIDKFCDEVRHMLDDHLELHGIPRGTTGIPGSVLQDKLKLINHGQEQMKSKYVDYAEIRRRLEAEVNQEAAARVAQGALDKPTSQRQHQYQQGGDLRGDNVDHKIPRGQAPRPADQDRLPHSARSARSSQSDWDDDSHTRVNLPHTNSPQRLMQQPAPPLTTTIQTGHVNDYRPGIDVKMRSQSPRKSPDRRSNAHLSSDFSNTIDSSAWQTESKAVTSVPHRGSQAQRPAGTNRSSDYDDRSDFST